MRKDENYVIRLPVVSDFRVSDVRGLVSPMEMQDGVINLKIIVLNGFQMVLIRTNVF